MREILPLLLSASQCENEISGRREPSADFGGGSEQLLAVVVERKAFETKSRRAVKARRLVASVS